MNEQRHCDSTRLWVWDLDSHFREAISAGDRPKTLLLKANNFTVLLTDLRIEMRLAERLPKTTRGSHRSSDYYQERGRELPQYPRERQLGAYLYEGQRLVFINHNIIPGAQLLCNDGAFLLYSKPFSGWRWSLGGVRPDPNTLGISPSAWRVHPVLRVPRLATPQAWSRLVLQLAPCPADRHHPCHQGPLRPLLQDPRR